MERVSVRRLLVSSEICEEASANSNLCKSNATRVIGVSLGHGVSYMVVLIITVGVDGYLVRSIAARYAPPPTAGVKIANLWTVVGSHLHSMHRRHIHYHHHH